ncbi:hypothetical protein PAMC26577_36080 [Caballeronia sordidicola]|uniref:Uncharacterized protein n=1 Tax=Caballeronia sordidicola TaxID=196367 RepID=A0A242M985_CABSO|nr:hypothetical protein PAMC26577_36080 [Caballeronia sordidicola]
MFSPRATLMPESELRRRRFATRAGMSHENNSGDPAAK